jgi:hypothetical protein
MTQSRRPFAVLCRTGIALAAAAVFAIAALPSAALAQLSAQSGTTSGSSCSGGNNADGFCGFSRGNTVANGTQFGSRYAWNVNADVGAFSTRDQSGTAVHTLSFNATAPGGYRLDVATQRTGIVQRNDDLLNCEGSAQTSAITGSSNFGISSGSLSLPQPTNVGNGGGDNHQPFNQTGSATIFRVSNNVAQSHTLTFSWTGSVRSNSCEAAVRQGEQNGSTTDCGACEYAGTPARTQASDGHFVTVTYTSLCGNGVVDASVGEQCDLAGSNGSSTSCCTSQCTFRASGQTCRAATGGGCDVAETCSGAAATCPADGFQPNGFVCRGSAGDCDPQETCSGSSPNCPIDQLSPNTVVCRAASDLCDAAENCTGSSPTCPGDAVQPASHVCRVGIDLCDLSETCDGSTKQCPPDVIEPATTVCRPSAGPCDVAELCDGATTACPSDAFTTGNVCRPAAGLCDVADTCDGTQAGCGPDVLQPSSAVCRPAVGDCDIAESCTGSSPACPPNVLEPATTVCRPAVDICDIAENCTGVSGTCPADVLSPDADSDGECDLIDNCDDVANAGQEDADLDGVGDACDACTNVNGARDALKRRIGLQKILLPQGDDRFTLRGQVTIPVPPSTPTAPAVNPVANGARIVLDNAVGNLLDITLPGGAYTNATKIGWRVNPTNTRWTYKNNNPSASNPIQGIALSTSPRTPGVFKFSVRGKNGAFATGPGDTPLRAIVVIDSPTAESGQCSELSFPGAASCKFNRSYSQVTCK